MNTKHIIILSTLFIGLSASSAFAADSCKTNNVYSAYEVPFTCQQDNQALTTSAVDTVNFRYQQASNRCTIVSNKPETVYLNHYVSCKENATRNTTRKIQLTAGANVVDFSSSCYRDSSSNQANLFFEKRENGAQPVMMISCTKHDTGNADSSKDAAFGDNFKSLSVL